jgi:hypothetical protein
MREPATILPGQIKKPIGPAKAYITPVHNPPNPPTMDGTKSNINMPRLMNWIASVGRTEKDADEVAGWWVTVHDKLQALGVNGDKTACNELPERGDCPSFNGRELTRWIETCDKSDIDDLQKVFAAMRLRVRHAKWLAKRGK